MKPIDISLERENSYRPHRRFIILMVAIMLIKVLGFFSILVGGIGVIQAIKIVLRVSMTLLTVLLYFVYTNKHASVHMKLAQPFPFFLYCTYLLLGFASLLWTTNLAFSATQLAMTIEGCVFALIYQKLLLTYNYSHDGQPIQLNLILGYTLFIISCGMIVGMFVAPDVFYRHTHGGEVARLGGLLQNPNEVGMMCVIGAATIYSLMKEQGVKPFYIFMILIFAYTTYETKSRSSSAAFLIFTSVFIMQYKNKVLKVVFMSMIIALAPVVFFTIFLKQGDVQEVMTMTGRTDFWKVLLTEGLPRNPWLGNGYMRLSYSDYYYTHKAMNASMAHNTYVEVLMNLGLIGGFIVFWQIVTTAVGIINTKDNASQYLYATMFAELLLNSVTEFGIYGHNNYGILFYQLLLVSLLFSKEIRLSVIQKIRLRNGSLLSS